MRWPLAIVIWAALLCPYLGLRRAVAQQAQAAAEDGDQADPFDELLRRASEALDESYDGWQYRADEAVDSTSFAINFSASIAADGRGRLDRVMILHADPDRDRSVTRGEARRFLEIQLGLRWATGELLRRDDGRLVDFAEFLRCDADQNDELSHQELVDNAGNTANADELFTRLDANRDGRITVSEFGGPAGPYLHDPIEWFRSADTDLDARLDAAELQVATPERRGALIRSNLAAFDDDGDGRLSLAEYRLSMLANYNCLWEQQPRDEDRDQRLSLQEFKFDTRDLFQLLRRYYFHRLDRDGDGMLSAGEFDFQLHKLYALHRISVDGEESREIFRDESFPTCSSPAVSPDGKWILFDASPDEGANQSQILRITADGHDVQRVCDGLMPSWSPDGARFACSRYQGGSGVWIMNLDGTPVQRIGDGWAAQWSPDGQSIAYTSDNNLLVYELASRQTRVVLAKGEHPYLYIHWNMCWSPDSRRLVFKGRLADQQHVVTVQMSGEPNLKTVWSTRSELVSDFAWSPDGRRILFSMQSRQHLRNVVHQLDLESGGPPVIVPEADTALAWTSLCFSPDGKWMVAATSY